MPFIWMGRDYIFLSEMNESLMELFLFAVALKRKRFILNWRCDNTSILLWFGFGFLLAMAFRPTKMISMCATNRLLIGLQQINNSGVVLMIWHMPDTTEFHRANCECFVGCMFVGCVIVCIGEWSMKDSQQQLIVK